MNAALGYGRSFTIKNLLKRFGVGRVRAGDIREPIAIPDSVWMPSVNKITKRGIHEGGLLVSIYHMSSLGTDTPGFQRSRYPLRDVS